MMTYAAYVWSAVAIFIIALLWDFFSPMIKLQGIRKRTSQIAKRANAASKNSTMSNQNKNGKSKS